MDVSNYLQVEVFMKVMNGFIVMTLEEDKRFLICVWLFYYEYLNNLADSRMEVPRYRSSPTP